MVCGFRGFGFSLLPCFSCPHLYSDFRVDFASDSSRFLAAVSCSASLPLPSSSVPSVSSLSLPSQPPVAPVPVSSSLAPSAPPLRFPAPLLPPFTSSTPSALPPVLSSASLSLPDWRAVQGGAAIALGLAAVPVSLPVPPPVSAPSIFRPFAADPAPSVPVPAAPLSSTLPSAPLALDFFRVLLSLLPHLLLFLRLLLLPSWLRISFWRMRLRMLCLGTQTRRFLRRFRV